jgi:NitT/TauT family transport system substrate-binding protein
MKKSADGARGQAVTYKRLRASLHLLVAFCLVFAAASPALAEEQVRIGLVLSAYICEDLKLIEKHGKESLLDLRPSYQRFLGASPLQDALASGAIDLAPFGTAPLLAAWEKAKDTPRQIFAVSGLTTLPPVLLSNRSGIRSLADFRSVDRIAVPSRSVPQLYLLRMQSERVFGQYDKLRGQIVVLSHAQAVNDLVGEKDSLTGYFSSAPYTEIALADGRIHKVLSASDVIEGKASFLILGASKGYIASHPKVPEAVAKAIDEAARIIRESAPCRRDLSDARAVKDARCGSGCRRAVRAQGRIRQRRARRRSFRRFHGPAWRAQIATVELEGDRCAGAVEFAQRLVVRTCFADRALSPVSPAM